MIPIYEGVNGPDEHRILDGNGMPLTEYTAENPPTQMEKIPPKYKVPKDYLMPDGYPDVSHESVPDFQCLIRAVPQAYSYIASLRYCD